MRTHFSMGRLLSFSFGKSEEALRRRYREACRFAVEGLESRTLLSVAAVGHGHGWQGRVVGKMAIAVSRVGGGQMTAAASAAALPAPTGVVVSGATTTSIRVSWNAVSGADHYVVLQKKVLHSPKGSLSTIYWVGVASTTGTSVVLGLTGGTFEVEAVDVNGVASAPSAPASGAALSAASLYDFLWGGAVMSTAWVEVGQTLNVTLLGYGNEKPTYVMDSGPSTMSVDPVTGVVTFTPTAGEAGYESATFTATNSVGSSTATFQFHILSAPTVVVTGGVFTFDGQTHGATAVAYGTDGVTPVAGTISFLYAPAWYPSALGTAPYAEAGNYIVQATFTSSDPNYGGGTGSSTIEIDPAVPVMAMADSEVTFNGGVQTIPAVALGVDGMTPVNGTYVTTYNGSTTAPIDPGVYAVVTTFTSSDGDYTGVTNSATLTIDPVSGQLVPAVVFDAGPFTYNGNAQGPGAVAVGGDGVTAIAGTMTYLYDGSPTPPTDAGTYTVEADFVSADPAFTDVTATETYTIDPAAPTVTVVGGVYTYNGLPQGAVVNVVGVDGVTPVAGTVTVNYDGGAVPVDAGYYGASATFTSADPNYSDGFGYDVTEIDPATPAFTSLAAKNGGGGVVVSGHLGAGPLVPAGDGVSIRFAGVTQVATVDVNGNFAALFAMPAAGQSYTVRYAFAGDLDFNAATGLGRYTPPLGAPVVRTQPAGQTVAAGSVATFTASASGSPTPYVQWQVSTDGGATFANISGATGLAYMVTTSVAMDGTLYRAVFSNKSGTAVTLEALLTVVSLA